MNAIPDDDRLGFFLAQMATKTGPADRLDLFRNAVIEAGGDYSVPAADAARHSHPVEVSLFGIHDAGATEDEALANWFARATDHTERRRATGRAERIVLSDMRGRGPEELRAAAERVRLYSTDAAAIDAARRLGMVLATGRLA